MSNLPPRRNQYQPTPVRETDSPPTRTSSVGTQPVSQGATPTTQPAATNNPNSGNRNQRSPASAVQFANLQAPVFRGGNYPAPAPLGASSNISSTGRPSPQSTANNSPAQSPAPPPRRSSPLPPVPATQNSNSNMSGGPEYVPVTQPAAAQCKSGFGK